MGILDIESTYSFFSNLNDDNISFIYQGNFSDEIADKANQLSTGNIILPKDSAELKKNIAMLTAECIQNIIFSKTNSIINKPGIFLTRNIGDIFCTTSAYLVETKELDSLKERIAKIPREDKDSLYKLFEEVVAGIEQADQKAMLAKIVDLARKSENVLEFDFDPAGNGWSYFYLQTVISTSKINAETLNSVRLNITTAKDFHKAMRDKNVMLIYRGDFSQKAVISLLRILEKGIQQNHFENISEKKVMFHIITEMLQNVSKHSVTLEGTKKGIFLIGKNVKGFFISTGNFIDNNKARNLKDQLNQINMLDQEERNNLYRVILKTGVLTENGGAGLGLIDIARETKNKFSHKFSPISDNVSFLSLGVNY